MFLGIFGSSLRNPVQARHRAEGSLQAHRGARRARRADRLLQPPLHHADCSTTRSPRAPQRAPCSVALIDLDWFKRINDAHGHPAGDEVLRTFAITMFANIRPIDNFGRYGGEEFLLILPGTTDDAAARMLDRLRGIVAELDWSAFSPGMTRDDFRRRRDAARRTILPTRFSRAPTARFIPPRRKGATVLQRAD